MRGSKAGGAKLKDDGNGWNQGATAFENKAVENWCMRGEELHVMILFSFGTIACFSANSTEILSRISSSHIQSKKRTLTTFSLFQLIYKSLHFLRKASTRGRMAANRTLSRNYQELQPATCAHNANSMTLPVLLKWFMGNWEVTSQILL
jgi:hypothetical protein